MARLTADDLVGPQRARVEDWLADCADCRRLVGDLRDLRQSLAADLPSPVRQRDFRLTEAQVRRRPGWSPLGWLGRLLTTDSSLVSPMAGAAMLVGLFLLVGSSAFGGGFPFPIGGATGGAAPVLAPVRAPMSAPAVSAPAAGGVGSGTAPSEAPRAVASASGGSASPTTPADQGALEGSVSGRSSPYRSTSSAAPPEATAGTPVAIGYLPGPPSGPAPLAGLGIVLLVLGALVLGGRWLSRRRAA